MSIMLRTASVLVLGVMMMGAGTAPVPLISHRALYDVTLENGVGLGGIVGADGRMVIEFSKSCDGFKTRQRMLADMSDVGQSTTRTDFVATTWESADGRNFRFDTLNADGANLDRLRGTASRAAGGKAGRAVYRDPKGMILPLPAGTLFPTEYLEGLIAAARSGASTYVRNLFQGDSSDDVYEASAFIGNEERGPAKADALLKGVRSWPVAISYYVRKNETAAYQAAFRLYENGVLSDLRISYPDFTLKGRLVKLQPIVSPSKC